MERRFYLTFGIVKPGDRIESARVPRWRRSYARGMACRWGTLASWGSLAASLLVACGDGAELRAPSSPAPEPPVLAPDEPGLPGQNLFVARQVLTVRLTMDPAVFEELEEHGNREEYVPAAARLERTGRDNVELAQLGVRHKGAYSLHHCWDEFGGVRSRERECAKLSLKLEFDAYDPQARFDGLKRLNLHASSGDASKLHELSAYQAFRDFGVDAPRALPARVFVNGQLLGLFIAVEEVDGRYTRAHFPDAPDGNLYKEVWPNAAADDAAFRLALETNEDSADVSGMRAFAEAVSSSAPETFEARLGPFVEIEPLLRYIAVDRALRNWDGIMAFYSRLSPHNFYWYQDDGPAPRFHLIPWDLDNTFWPFDPYMDPQQWVTAPPIPDFNAEPRDCEPRPIWESDGPEYVTPPRCDRLLDGLAEQHWPRLVELGRELSAGPLAPARLSALADEWVSLLEPLVAEDPTIDPAEFQSGVLEFRQVAAEVGPSLEAFLSEGLIQEAAVVDPIGPVPEEIDAPTLDEGLLIESPTNFEFVAPPTAAMPSGVFTYGDPLAAYGAAWSTDTPISGSADLLFSFTFSRGPGSFDEWVGVGISSAETDVSGYSRVVAWLSADKERTVRLRLVSPAYDEQFGGVLAEFGMDFAVGPEPRPVVLAFEDVYYPSWAKQGWATGQGFPGTDAEALQQVLQRFSGLAFGPAATMDAAGELAAATETGHLRVDNIYFR
jgi:spore coat protein H